MTSRDEEEARGEFAARYGLPTPGFTEEIERRVLGGAWGANGYTTIAQADEVARALHLGPGKRLLDVGTGRGYPGLYLAATTGCAVAGTDLPHEAILAATRRAARDHLASRAGFVVAAGAAQPFRRGTFDGVVLNDVLC